MKIEDLVGKLQNLIADWESAKPDYRALDDSVEQKTVEAKHDCAEQLSRLVDEYHQSIELAKAGYYLLFKDYHEHTERWLSISQKQFEQLKPHSYSLSQGNGTGDDQIDDLAEELYDQHWTQAAKLSSKQIKAIPFDHIIEYAIV